MRQETINLYTFDELSEEAKAVALEHWRWNNAEDHWGAESLASIRAFCDEFGVELTGWSIGAYSPVNYSTDAKSEHFRGRKLREFSRDHMPTGYCLDYALWATFWDVFKKTGDAKAAFEAGLYSGFHEWRDDIEAQLSDEYLSEHLSANCYEFTEAGELY